MKRPTITDVAREAGVSVATVDRVLNSRRAVREATARRVLEAAEKLGFHATGLLLQRLGERPPERVLGFLLQKGSDPFYQALGADLAAATRNAGAIRGRPVVEFMDEISPEAIVGSLRTIGRRVDAVAVVAVDHPLVSEEIAHLRARGVQTFTLLSDLTAQARSGYVGLDNRKAGRSAAWAIARLSRKPGRVGILVGSHRYLGQELAEISFRSYFRELAPEFVLLEPLINLDDPHLAREAALTLLKRNPDMVGFYAAGGGAQGVIDALRETGLNERVVFVCNELTPGTRAGLIGGVVDMVINTPTALLAARAVEAMAKAIETPPDGPGIQILLPFDLYVSENI